MFDVADANTASKSFTEEACALFVSSDVLDLRQPVDGAGIGGFGRDVLLRPDGGHDRHLVLHGVEDDHDRGPHQERIGHADGVGFLRGQPLHEAHRVIAEVAEHACRHGRQVFGDIDAG